MTFRVHAHRGADVALAAFLLQQGCSSSRELVEHFLEQGADPTCTTTMRGTGSKHRLVVEGTSVMVAARLKQWEVVSRLIEAGADLNVKDSLGSSLAKPAVEDGQMSILALLRGRNVPAFDALAEHGSVIVMSLASGFLAEDRQHSGRTTQWRTIGFDGFYSTRACRHGGLPA